MRQSRVWNRPRLDDGREAFEASLAIAYPKLKIRETFYSDVVCDPGRSPFAPRRTREPLKHLDSRWLFTPAGEGADVSISVDYQMRAKMLQL